jgi:hypothetical protein
MSDPVSINMAGEGVFDYGPIKVALTDIMEAFHWLTVHPHYFKKVGFTDTSIATRNDPCGLRSQFISEGRSKHRLVCGMETQPHIDQPGTSPREHTQECHVADATHKRKGKTNPLLSGETKLFASNR